MDHQSLPWVDRKLCGNETKNSAKGKVAMMHLRICKPMPIRTAEAEED